MVFDVLINVNFEIKLVSDKERECIKGLVKDDVFGIDDDKEEPGDEEVSMDVSLKLTIDVLASDKWIGGIKVDDDDKEEKAGDEEVLKDVSLKLPIDVLDKWIDGIKDEVIDNDKDKEEDEDRVVVWEIGSEKKK